MLVEHGQVVVRRRRPAACRSARKPVGSPVAAVSSAAKAGITVQRLLAELEQLALGVGGLGDRA